jgi:S1-C subfamily serine protease
MSELDDAYIKGTGLPNETQGVLIKGFVQGSPGQASGLKLNDIIEKINGKDMHIPKDVKEFVQSRKSGEILNFIVLRDKQVQAVPVNVGSYPRNFNSRIR